MAQEKKKTATAGRPRKPREAKAKEEAPKPAAPITEEPEQTDNTPPPATPQTEEPEQTHTEPKTDDPTAHDTEPDADKNTGADSTSGGSDNAAEENTNSAAPEETADGWEVARVLKVTKPLMNGDDVKALQEALIARNYHCGIAGADGIYAKNTAYAIRCFQSAHGLIVDGKAGRYTVAALGGVWKG